jgi:hypothetical protein
MEEPEIRSTLPAPDGQVDESQIQQPETALILETEPSDIKSEPRKPELVVDGIVELADDDFDDFGDFDSSPANIQAIAQPQLNSSISVEIYPQPETDLSEESRLESILPSIEKLDPAYVYMELIKNTFTLSRLPDIPIEVTPLEYKTPSEEWEETVKNLDSKYINDVFRWRKSFTRHEFIASLSKVVVEVPRRRSSDKSPIISHQQEDIAEKALDSAVRPTQFDTDDPREMELISAKKLVDISSIEMNSKTPQQLQTLINTLTEYNSKIQSQTNYYLDSKEQLVMESEMHNKMISNLVLYAQQQQEDIKVSLKGKKKK